MVLPGLAYIPGPWRTVAGDPSVVIPPKNDWIRVSVSRAATPARFGFLLRDFMVKGPPSSSGQNCLLCLRSAAAGVDARFHQMLQAQATSTPGLISSDGNCGWQALIHLHPPPLLLPKSNPVLSGTIQCCFHSLVVELRIHS